MGLVIPGGFTMTPKFGPGWCRWKVCKSPKLEGVTVLKVKTRTKRCEHTVTETSQTAGLSRTTCLNCGHISFQYKEEGVSRRAASASLKLATSRRGQR